MEYNRDKDGKFAPKGTGDKTGFEKGFHKAMPKGLPVKTVSLPFSEKPTLDEVLPDLYDIMNADYADEKQEAEADMQTYKALMEAAGRAEPDEAEAIRKEAEGWKRHADELSGAKTAKTIWDDPNHPLYGIAPDEQNEKYLSDAIAEMQKYSDSWYGMKQSDRDNVSPEGKAKLDQKLNRYKKTLQYVNGMKKKDALPF